MVSPFVEHGDFGCEVRRRARKRLGEKAAERLEIARRSFDVTAEAVTYKAKKRN
jgi:hypothetical protein